MMTWEYQLCVASLNRLGREGWELVAIRASGSGKDGSWSIAILKRPLADPVARPDITRTVLSNGRTSMTFK